MKQNYLKARMPVIFIIIILALASIGLARRCGLERSSLNSVYRHPGGDTLAVAIQMSPLTYTLRNDTAEGFDYQILRDIAEAHGLAIRFYPVSQLEKAFLGLKDGDYDLVVGALPSTSTLKKYFPTTDAVYIDRQVLVQRRDSTGVRGPVTSQQQLMHDTVWLAEGSPFQSRMANLSAELGDSIFIITASGHSSEHLAIMTALGEVKQAVVNEAVASRIAADYPQLDISTPMSFSQFQCWAVTPGDSALLDSLNTWLGEFRKTEQFERLVQKYM
ncbi:MAG: transporter substrate-binding domain-containing protein [Muribaculaceae bacterium]|nr:transporter substrate-binding domain-containing protein [Muribaculaceae bacterium]